MASYFQLLSTDLAELKKAPCLAQHVFQQRYGASLVDDDGREIPISNDAIDKCLQALAGSNDEFICVLARRSGH
ncbi:MAG: hypothetical protein R3221_05975 [Spongiibacter sp.]|uniref:Uncharacterized protein n=1 Tax=Spongiibacter thalassae TaxID=2721624 RepID=A0ABX1GFY0_9GAMM|nr:hypothetical protein [Spongiibacter thalassae]MDX1505244.1 hypothetical protein [Spongiibacter sp.]NKI17292.1 hypothetical protein [Spongiibacter thalassae]